jgi:hypothetical protein
MAKNELKMAFKDSISERNNERDIMEDIAKTGFLSWLAENGYKDNEIKDMFNDKKRLTSTEQNRFNLALRRCKNETGVKIFEMIVYLDDYFQKTKKILNIIDEETTLIIKKELAKKYKILIEKNDLRQIFG